LPRPSPDSRNPPEPPDPGQWTADLKFWRDSAQDAPARVRQGRPEVSAAVADGKRIPILAIMVIVEWPVLSPPPGRPFAVDPASRLGRGDHAGPYGAAPQTEGLYLRVLPVKLLWLSDGLFVQAAAKDRAELLGARLARIGAMDAAAALEKVRPVVSYDSEMWFKNWAPQMLAVPRSSMPSTRTRSTRLLRFRLRDGREAALALEAMDPGLKIDWITASQTAKPPKPLYLRNPGDLHWFEFDPATKLFYCQINGIQDKPDETLAQFSARMIAAAKPPAKFVLDIRPAGGNNPNERSFWPSSARPRSTATGRSSS
jgi:hypothetical protein